MDSNRKRWLFLLISLVLATLIFLAAGLNELELLPPDDFPFWIFGFSEATGEGGSPLLGLGLLSLEIFSSLAILFMALLLLVWIITFFLRPHARKRMLTRLISYFIVLLLLLALSDVIQRGFNGLEGTEGQQTLGESLSELMQASEAPPTPNFILNPPPWLTPFITLTLMAFILGLAWFVWQRRSRPRSTPVERLVEEAQQAIEEIRTGCDLKDTVMRCYHEMSQVLSQQRGLERRKTMTPREFEHHLVEAGLRNEHIRRLTRLFESVRYGAKTPGQREEQEAMACLSAIVEAYGSAS